MSDDSRHPTHRVADALEKVARAIQALAYERQRANDIGRDGVEVARRGVNVQEALADDSRSLQDALERARNSGGV